MIGFGTGAEFSLSPSLEKEVNGQREAKLKFMKLVYLSLSKKQMIKEKLK